MTLGTRWIKTSSCLLYYFFRKIQKAHKFLPILHFWEKLGGNLFHNYLVQVWSFCGIFLLEDCLVLQENSSLLWRYHKGLGLIKFRIIDENRQQNWVKTLELWMWISAEISALVRCCSSIFPWKISSQKITEISNLSNQLCPAFLGVGKFQQ